jgi:hypothetical protein
MYHLSQIQLSKRYVVDEASLCTCSGFTLVLVLSSMSCSTIVPSIINTLACPAVSNSVSEYNAEDLQVIQKS